MNILSIIPARSGSIRIKNKKIKLFNGKPIISKAILNALESKIFDKVYVSTDSNKIKKIAEKYGAIVPYLRPMYLSKDNVYTIEVIKHFINYLNKQNMNIELNGNVIIRHQAIPDCDKCDNAKKLLEEKGLKYSIINADKKFFGNLMKQTKSTQVPQIIIDGEFVGDYDQLKEHLN